MNPSRKKSSGKKVKEVVKTSFRDYLLLSAILILTFLLYANSLHNDLLHFDDTEYFATFSDITHLSWLSVKSYFSNYYLLMYQPLPILTFAIQFYFTSLHPFPLHFVNLCVHLVNVLLVYQFTGMLFKNKNIALLIALAFAIHPMNAEAVSWISARSSGMYTMFYLCGLICYAVYIREKYKIRYLFLALMFFIFSLFSKSQAVTLPLLLLLIDFINNRKIISRKVVLEKVPFFILSVIFAWITLSNPDMGRIMEKGMIASFSPVDNFFLVCWSFAFYLVKFLLPINLCAACVFPPKTGGLLGWEYYISPLLLIITGVFLFMERRNKMMMFGAACFLATIFLNIQIIPSRLVITADRYAYFPYLGLFFMMAAYLQQKYEMNPRFFQKYKALFLGLGFLYVVFFSVTLYARNNTWKNDLVFMSDMISKNPEVPYLYRAYGTRGNYLWKHGHPDEAIQDYTKAIQLKPDNASAYSNRAIVNLERQNFSAAVNDADSAIKYHSIFEKIYQIRAVGKYYLNDWRGALEDCDRCLKINQSDSRMLELHTALLDSLQNHHDTVK